MYTSTSPRRLTPWDLQGKQLSAGSKLDTASSAVEGAGPNSGLILAGLAAVAVVGVGVAAQNQGGDAAASSAGGSAPSTGGSEGGVSDAIAARKKEAKQWIEEWRKETGGNSK